MKKIFMKQINQVSWSVWLEEHTDINANGHNPVHALKELKKVLKAKGLTDTIKGSYEVVFLAPDDL